MTAPLNSEAERRELLLGYGYISLMVFAFGSAPTLSRLAFEGGVGAFTLQSIRFLSCAVILSLILFARRQFVVLDRRQKWLLLGLMVVTTTASFGYGTSVKYIPVPLASLIFFIFPVLVGPLAHIVGDEKLTHVRVAALLVGFSGLSLVLAPTLGSVDIRGVLLALLGGVSVAVSFLFMRRLTVSVPSMQLSAMVTAGASCLFIGAVLGWEGYTPPTTSLGWFGVIANAGVYTIGLVCLYAGVRRLGSLRAAIVSNVEPIISLLIAAAVLGQLLELTQLFGAAIVVSAIFLMQNEARLRRLFGKAD